MRTLEIGWLYFIKRKPPSRLKSVGGEVFSISDFVGFEIWRTFKRIAFCIIETIVVGKNDSISY